MKSQEEIKDTDLVDCGIGFMDNKTKRDHLRTEEAYWKRQQKLDTTGSAKEKKRAREDNKGEGKKKKNKTSKANDIENVNVNIQQVIYVDDSKTASIMLNDIFKQYLRLNKFKQSHYCILLPQRQHYFLLH